VPHLPPGGDTVTTTVDFDAFYRVKSQPGIAWTLRGWVKEWTQEEYVLDCEDDHEHEPACYLYNEPEQVDRDDMVEAVMVGDDGVHQIDVDDLVVITEDDFCHGCGQIGCGH
jgi:hypothetical protein